MMINKFLFLFSVAIRYLSSVRREKFMNFITSVAIIGIALGVMALLISLTILHGFDKTLNTNLISFVGHIQVTQFDGGSIKNRDSIIERIKAVPNVESVSPFVSKEGIIRTSEGLEGILFKGIYIDKDVSKVRNKMVEGEFKNIKPGSIVIGKKLGVKLNLKINDTATIFASNGLPNSNNPSVVEQFKIVGFYQTGIGEYDNMYIYGCFDDVKKIASIDENNMTGCDILVKNTDSINFTSGILETVLEYPMYPRTVYDTFQSIFAWLDLQRKPIPIVLGLITIVAVFNIIGTLLMVVLEKTESIGTLATIGTTPSNIRWIFIIQGLIINTIGLIIGLVISLAFTFVQYKWKLIPLNSEIYFVDAVPVSFYYSDYLIVIATSYLLCFAATFVPAFVAGKLRPVQALSFK